MTQSSSSSFDPYAWRNFYFEIDREEATRMLCEHPDSTLGTFLIRDSTSAGGYALSVREELAGDQQVRHYLIEPVEDDDGSTSVKIADQRFVDIPALLNHFKMRILANVSLVRPLQKAAIEKMIALYSFEGEQTTDLPFEKNELLEIIGKPQEGWWQARNALGATGLVPANYLAHLEDVIVERGSSPDTSSISSENRLSNVSAASEGNDSISCSSPPSAHLEDVIVERGSSPDTSSISSENRLSNVSAASEGNDSISCSSPPSAHLEDVIVERGSSPDTSSISSENRLSNVSAASEGNDSISCSSPPSRRVPSWARVMLDRRPNVYDTEALRLKKGELIKVTKVHPSGICEGILNGKKGTFPFTYVEFISDEDATTPIAH
ncbi:Cell death abnormality protein 2 [Toxocara canis]|uniref:Cell death abnormality protein 2 n=1 Tax=Toxocara canis TaxID=6265 RepID=A0A0B2VXF8_TOXCA|nr:Cell death abnormality protein 2 [Toxocara canis]